MPAKNKPTAAPAPLTTTAADAHHPINEKLEAALKLINEAAQMERALYCPAPSGVPEMTEEDASLAHRLIGCIAGALLKIEGADGDVEEALREHED